MIIRNNMCILLLVTIFFVSCKFFGNAGTSKEGESLLDAASKTSNLGLDTSYQEENASDVTGGSRENKSILTMIADAPSPAASDAISRDNQENKDKLTEDDNKKLMDFFRTTATYQSILDSIYNKYTRSYNTIATYGSCDEYRIGCFSEGPSVERRKALAMLKNNKLEEEYDKLSNMLKSSVFSYRDNNTLDNAIKEYRKAISKASETEHKIKIVKDYKAVQEAKNEEKKENVDSLKTVADVLPVIKKTIETACLFYADAFAVVTSSLSCNEFRQAINEFNAAAKEYANGDKGDNAVDVIVGPIASMAYSGSEDGFDNAKKFANNKTGEEVKKMIKAIDKLRDVYKRVKP
ncbi:hypothetical protein [Borreliella americana]|uniref:hypothetical protein n=1 Tax=Borreliella americana TaxID=478807 RepID=UPI001E536F9F|nr:hypothetical protein [Borreliella americana]MCD2332637.1 hypothetical protein [Borreliella americana]